MDRGAWQAIVRGISRVGHDLETKPPQLPPYANAYLVKIYFHFICIHLG